jgi:hypothetical protein
MNAIQVMRQRAAKAGRLKNNDKLRVASAAAPQGYAPSPDMQPVYGGPAVIEPPPQYITIEPVQPDVVYVPAYDPQVIYGAARAGVPRLCLRAAGAGGAGLQRRPAGRGGCAGLRRRRGGGQRLRAARLGLELVEHELGRPARP